MSRKNKKNKNNNNSVVHVEPSVEEVYDWTPTIPVADGFKFSPYAWQKVLFFLHRGDTEVGGMCIQDENDDNLIVDFKLIKQQSSVATVDFDKEDMEEYVNLMLDHEIQPNKCFRIWLHTHPGSSASPSSQDWETFNELMSNYPWFAMLIVSRTHETYGYLQLTQGPGLGAEVNLSVDWNIPCEDIDFNELDLEYEEKVEKKKSSHITKGCSNPHNSYSRFGENYDEIDWRSGSALSDRWSNSNHNYTNVNRDFDEEDFLVDDDELEDLGMSADEYRDCFNEYMAGDRSTPIRNKSLHQMSDEEFEELID